MWRAESSFDGVHYWAEFDGELRVSDTVAAQVANHFRTLDDLWHVSSQLPSSMSCYSPQNDHDERALYAAVLTYLPGPTTVTGKFPDLSPWAYGCISVPEDELQDRRPIG